MKRLPLFIIMICATNAIAQVSSISVRIGTNLPIIPSVTQESQVTVPSQSSGYAVIYPNVGSIIQTFKGKVGIYAACNLEIKLNGKWFASSGLTLNYTRFNRTVKVEKLDLEMNPSTGYGSFYGNIWIRDVNGNLIQREVTVLRPPNGSTTLFGLQLPITVGRTFLNDKLSVSAGAFVSYLLSASVYNQNISYVNTSSGYQLQFNEYKEHTTKGFESLGTGLMFSTSYLVTSKITIDLSAQKGFSPIFDTNNSSTNDATLNSLMLGMGYRFSR